MVALSSIFERLVLLEAEARCPPSKRGRPRELSDSEALSRIEDVQSSIPRKRVTHLFVQRALLQSLDMPVYYVLYEGSADHCVRFVTI